MLSAIDTKKDEKVMAKDVPTTYETEKGRFMCPHPDCGGLVFPKKGPKKIDHFAHYPDTMNINHEWWEPETERHMEIKRDMEEFFSHFSAVDSIELEVGLKNTRPDLLITLRGDFSIAIECQHTEIPLSKIEMRTDSLMKENKVNDVIWILDKRSFSELNDFWYYSDHLEFNNALRRIEKEEAYDPDNYSLFNERRKLNTSEGYYLLEEILRKVLGLDKEDIFFSSKRESRNEIEDKVREYNKVKSEIYGIVENYAPSKKSELVNLLLNNLDKSFFENYWIRPILSNLKRCRCGNFLRNDLLDTYNVHLCRECLNYPTCSVCGKYVKKSKIKKGVCFSCRRDWAKSHDQ